MSDYPENPLSRVEQYLDNIAGGSAELPPKPLSRIEQYLAYIAENGGGGGGGTTNYDNLSNRPKINNVTLSGNKSLADLGINIPDITGLATKVELEAVTDVIPEQATSENQLADKDFVNSSINSVSAFPISYNASGDGFPTISSLLNAQTYYSGGVARVPTTNDYAFVTADTSKATQVSGYASFTTTDQYIGYYVMYNDVATLVTDGNKGSVGITPGTTVAYVAVPSTRYVYSIPAGQTSGAWNFQTVVTPLSFTAAQVKAINSGITVALVTLLSGMTHETWTFTLDDDTTVTKEVVIWPST